MATSIIKWDKTIASGDKISEGQDCVQAHSQVLVVTDQGARLDQVANIPQSC